MKKKLLFFLIHYIFLIGVPTKILANGDGDLNSSYSKTKIGLNYVSSTRVTKQRGVDSYGTPIPTFRITGIPVGAIIEDAFLYMAGSTISSLSFFNLSINNPSNIVESYAASLIGTTPDACWGYNNTKSFRANIKTIITGNGDYVVSGIPTAANLNDDMNGATIIVIYSDPSANFTGSIEIKDGSVVLVSSNSSKTIGFNNPNYLITPILSRGFGIVSDVQSTGSQYKFPNNVIVSATLPYYFNFYEANLNVTPSTLDYNHQFFTQTDCVQWVTAGQYYQVNNIELSNKSIPENKPGGTTVGNLFSFFDGNTSYSYSLVSGDGDDDNSYFTISGNTLQSATCFDFEIRSTYSIRVRSVSSSGVVSNEIFIITATDETEISVTAKAKNITVQLDTFGKAIIQPSDIDNGSTGNCGFDLSIDKNAFDCTNIGANIVSLTITDTNGGSNTTTSIVTIEDKVKPTVLTQNITVQLDASGSAVITPTQIDNGSTDNCVIDKITLNKTDFDCSNVGANTVTLTVLDVNGNSDSKTAIVTVEDQLKPIVITQNITIQLDALGKATITAAEIDNGSTDNCVIDKITLDKTDFDCSNVGANTVTLTVLDVNGNSDSKTATVTIEDKVKPMVVTQNITVQLDALGKAVITPAQIDNGSTDNCAIDKITLDKTYFDCSNIGGNTVTLTVLDVNGNSDSKTAIVTIEDQVKPTVITQNITIQLDASGKATIIPTQIDNGSTDNCAIDKITLDKTDFDCTNVGTNTVTLTVLDVNGNSDSKTATVTIEDKVKPMVVTQNITVQLDALGKAVITPAQIDNGSTDNCAIDKITLDKTDFDCSNIGGNTVTLTVLDVNGNSDSKTAIVTIEDQVKPTVITQNITIQLDALGKAIITESQIDNGSTDNCTIDKITLDKTDFDCSNIGTNTVTLTVLDVNGNSDSKTAIVIIEDQIKPTVVTQDITVQLDASGKVIIAPTQIDNGSNDNCVIDKITLDKTDFNCSNVGANTVTLTVLDVNGNSVSKTAILTIEDQVKPIVIIQNITVQLDALGKAIITESQIDNGSTDNCGIDTMTLDKTAFDCSNIGDNNVTLNLTDKSGNSASGIAVVTVKDLIAPTVITQNITVQLDATGNAILIPALINNGSTDNCGIDTMTLDKTNFDCSNIGDNTVTLTAIDFSGNLASKTATVKVEDKLKPIVITQNITVDLDGSGNAVITAAEIDNGSTDNCAIDKIEINKTSFTCSNVGLNTVTLTVTDGNGNSASKNATVTVQDKISPIVVTQNITVELNLSGDSVITEAQIDNGSTDNCAIDKMTLDKTTFNCSNLGDNIVTLTVKDKSGNLASATAIVTVLPLSPPVFSSLTQEFCAIENPVISSIVVNSAYLKWFKDTSSSQTLSSNTALTSGIYYAANYNGSCYSDRVAVTIIVNDALAPTGNAIQFMCKEKEATVTDLITNEEEVLWYETPIGGFALGSTTVLEDNHKYYASYTGAECESSKRFEVEVVFRYCDVKVYNGISANGDGKNDYFEIEGATTFLENKLEIFNSWGSLVFETANYGNGENLFRGVANKGLGSGKGLLPFGTYYYVFSFTNHDNKRVAKTGFLHLNP